MAPMLHEKGVRASDAFFVDAGDLDSTCEIKLTVEFLMNAHQDRTNDVSMYFKCFVTVLLAAHPSISILNWENPIQNPAAKVVGILTTEVSINQYVSGVVV